jgi:hypothetical protein
MAHHKLGNEQEALALLQVARDESEEHVPTPDGPPLRPYMLDRPLVWCELQVLLREAEALIEGEKSPGDGENAAGVAQASQP